MILLNPTDFGRDKDSFHDKFQNTLFPILDLKNSSHLKFILVLNVVKLKFKLELINSFNN